MKGVIPLLFFLLLLAGGLLLLNSNSDNENSDTSTTTTTSNSSNECYLVVYTVVDDSNNYGRITGVSSTSNPPSQKLAVSPDPGEPYIHVTVSRNAVLLEKDVGVGGGYTESYINVTTLKGVTADVKIQLYDPDTGTYGIPEHKLLDQYNATLTLCG